MYWHRSHSRLGRGRIPLRSSKLLFRQTILVFCCAAAVLTTAGCSGPSPVDQMTESAAQLPAPSAVSTTQAAPEGPLTGYVIAWVETGTVNVGTIDPETGEYADGPVFEVGDFAVAPNAPTTNDQSYFRRLVSPGFEFAYAQRIVDGDGHIGWVDVDGNFTDVTASVAGPRTDLSGPPDVNGHGFDDLGNFYYSTTEDGVVVVYRLPPGSTTGAVEVHRAQGFLVNPRITPEGTLSFDILGCFPRGSVGLLSDGYVWSDGTQVSRRSGVPPAESQSISGCAVGDVDLLPTANTSTVFSPVANEAEDRVAFILTDRNDLKSIYSVSALDGSSEVETDLGELSTATFSLVDWIA